MTVMRGHAGSGPVTEGIVMVCSEPFSARYDLDRRSGTFSRAGHPLAGESIAGRVLVFPSAKGGVATAWALLDLCSRGLGPAALVFTRTNPIMVQGAVLAHIAIVDRLAPDPLEVLVSGMLVRVDPAAGTVELLLAR